jgi:hypothetical protein
MASALHPQRAGHPRPRLVRMCWGPTGRRKRMCDEAPVLGLEEDAEGDIGRGRPGADLVRGAVAAGTRRGPQALEYQERSPQHAVALACNAGLHLGSLMTTFYPRRARPNSISYLTDVRRKEASPGRAALRCAALRGWGGGLFCGASAANPGERPGRMPHPVGESRSDLSEVNSGEVLGFVVVAAAGRTRVEI